MPQYLSRLYIIFCHDFCHQYPPNHTKLYNLTQPVNQSIPFKPARGLRRAKRSPLVKGSKIPFARKTQKNTAEKIIATISPATYAALQYL